MVRWLQEDYGLDPVGAHTLLGQCVEYEVGNVFDPATRWSARCPKVCSPRSAGTPQQQTCSLLNCLAVGPTFPRSVAAFGSSPGRNGKPRGLNLRPRIACFGTGNLTSRSLPRSRLLFPVPDQQRRGYGNQGPHPAGPRPVGRTRGHAPAPRPCTASAKHGACPRSLSWPATRKRRPWAMWGSRLTCPSPNDRRRRRAVTKTNEGHNRNSERRQGRPRRWQVLPFLLANIARCNNEH
jgi:hypothetical protein